jgi:hypothetical protein
MLMFIFAKAAIPPSDNTQARSTPPSPEFAAPAQSAAVALLGASADASAHVTNPVEMRLINRLLAVIATESYGIAPVPTTSQTACPSCIVRLQPQVWMARLQFRPIPLGDL